MLARIRRHVENEVPEAIVELGISYRDGMLGLPICSFKKAAKLFKRAVELGQAHAMFSLARLCFKGKEGVRQNTKKAIDLFRAAAERGHPSAMCEIGNWYLRASGKIEDAVPYYEAAANLGLARAQFNLGAIYWNGQGVKHDTEKAFIWVKRAAANGHEEATATLEMMNQDVAKLEKMNEESPAPPPS
jgi:hypothetical protein